MSDRWTVLVYLAANNELDPFARQAIHEMEQTGSTDALTMIVFVDFRRTGGDGKARRGKIILNPKWDEFDSTNVSPLDEIGAVNTGDPSVLSDFIAWGVTSFPGDHYGLVVWGHGSGWKPDFIYKAVEKAGGKDLSLAMRSANFADNYEKVDRLLFTPALDEAVSNFIHQSLFPQMSVSLRREGTAEPSGFDARSKWPLLLEAMDGGQHFPDLLMRAIAYDETSHQGLDSKALKGALDGGVASIIAKGGNPFVWSFLGFDACMMAGIEVCFEVRTLTRLIVGSEEIEPGRGWDYGLLMRSLTSENAGAGPGQLGTDIVADYICALSTYKVRLVTQSAIDPALLDELVQRLDALAQYLMSMIDTDYAGLARAEKTATRFYDMDFIDIGSYLDNLAVGLRAVDKTVIQAAASAYKKVVLASSFAFPRDNQHPTGLSLYYPSKPGFDQSYLTLSAGNKLPNWVSFIRAYHFLLPQLAL